MNLHSGLLLFLRWTDCIQWARKEQLLDVISAYQSRTAKLQKDEFAVDIRKNDRLVLDTGNEVHTIEIALLPDGTMSHWYVVKFLLQGLTARYVGVCAVLVSDSVAGCTNDKVMQIGKQRLPDMISLKNWLGEIAESCSKNSASQSR